MKPIVIYDFTDAEFESARQKLATVPKEQWPSDEMWQQVYLSALLKSMENGESDDELVAR